ncbi:MAG: DUF1707 domain-containing protein [Propioniciclava sp.]|uniref:DUF1707 SHOCT-like domain-containing protein n=1 Tax=Propioniciclava sp. TaxID=2038686 RepID=UPI0039E24678
MTDEPSAQQRLSDSERDEAASLLREHFEAGRLEASEFDERLSAALSARFASEFVPLFSDLPAPHPRQIPGAEPVPAFSAPPPVPRPADGAQVARNQASWLPMAQKVLWPGAILLALVTGNWWQFIVLAIVLSFVFNHFNPQRRQPPPYLDQ